MKNIKKIIPGMVLLLIFSGCGTNLYQPDSEDQIADKIGITQHNPESLWNYKIAREYAADGRYELAREHYLLALATANTPVLQQALTQELNGVDMMIKTLR